ACSSLPRTTEARVDDMEPATFASIPPKTESLRVFESEPALAPLGQLSVLDSSANESGRRVRGSRRAKVAVVLTDSVVVATSMLAAALRCTALGTKPEDSRTLLIVSIIALPLWLGVFARYRLYQTAAV